MKSWEKLRGGLRLEFVCGERALHEYRIVRDAVAGCIRYLSVAPEDLPAAIERLQGESRDLRRTIKGQQEQLAVHEAAALVARGQQVGGATVVVESVEGWDQAGLKALATSVASRPGIVAALVSTTAPALVVIARSPDLKLDASAVLRALIARFGGKGGGKPDFAQGGGLAGGLPEILAAARDLVDAGLKPGA